MAAVASNPSASGSGGYVWEDPGDSIMIQVSLDLIERLGAAVQQGLGAGSRGTEIGGILLGRTVPGFVRAVQIEDFELSPCEHLRGGSYTLSPRDRRALGTRLARRSARQVVGYFRSHTRPGMYLDQEDFTVFGHYFPEPSQVFLLVRPETEGPATGGFFFWEDGDLNRRSTYRQFPFDAARLAAGEFPITGEQTVAAATPRPAPVLVPKPEKQARVKDRKLPPLPWIVVPLIAVLFLIAGLFVSENQAPPQVTTAVKTKAPVVPLLPEPVPQAAVETPAPPREPVAQAPAEPKPVAPKPVAVSKPKPAKKALPVAVRPAPATVAHTPAREVEAPPALAAPSVKFAPQLAAVLPAHAVSAPPPEAEVSYDAPHPGVFKRAFRKIEGVSDVPASPIRKVAPARLADAKPVDVKVFIDASGNVSRAQLLTKGSDLASSALAAARQWQFTPASKNGRNIATEMVLHFR